MSAIEQHAVHPCPALVIQTVVNVFEPCCLKVGDVMTRS